MTRVRGSRPGSPKRVELLQEHAAAASALAAQHARRPPRRATRPWRTKPPGSAQRSLKGCSRPGAPARVCSSPSARGDQRRRRRPRTGGRSGRHRSRRGNAASVLPAGDMSDRASARQAQPGCSRPGASATCSRMPQAKSSRSSSMPSPNTVAALVHLGHELERRAPPRDAPARSRCRWRTLGNGSRTKNASAAPGRGQRAAAPALRGAIERAQPVAPVPVATMTPDDDWRSLLRRPSADAIARRLVGAVADEDLVEREQPLAVVECAPRPSCAPRLRARPRAAVGAAGRRRPRRGAGTSTPS